LVTSFWKSAGYCPLDSTKGRPCEINIMARRIASAIVTNRNAGESFGRFPATGSVCGDATEVAAAFTAAILTCSEESSLRKRIIRVAVVPRLRKLNERRRLERAAAESPYCTVKFVLSVFEPLLVVMLAVIWVVPAVSNVARPLLLMVATLVVPLDHCTTVLRF
jgi:hypothetical protein